MKSGFGIQEESEEIQVKNVTLKLKISEQIISLMGYASKQGIEYIRIMTNKGNFIAVGSDSNFTRNKRFELDVKKDCKPISLCGTYEERKSIIFSYINRPIKY